MKLVEKFKKSRLSGPLKSFPNSHVLAVGALTAVLGAVTMTSGEKAQASRQVGTLSLPDVDETVYIRSDISLESAVITPEAVQPELKKVSLKIKSGDNLSLLFKRAGLNDRAMMNFIAQAEHAKRLESIKPNHALDFYLNDNQQIERLTYRLDRLNSLTYSREGDTYIFAEEQRQPDIQRASREGSIQSSLYLAGQAAHMDDKLIMELAEIFGWDIDFALDIRKGDSFKVLYEELFLDGEKIGNGAILSAEFVNQKQRFQAVRYIHSDGRVEYYTPEGKNMRKAFLRAPLDFRRISSSFNPSRLHPITKTVKPHRGIDYAAKTGTPIWSSGDGRVIASSYNKYNGNYVVIQHGNNIQTKYLHLTKRSVKKGQKVRQKQIIGTLGSTGYATGPHLHYEFLLNGVHRNPRTIVQKLPKAESISAELRQDFEAQTRALIAELTQENNTELATSDASLLPSG